MNTALRVVQAVLAALYVMAGLWKVTGQVPIFVPRAATRRVEPVAR